jgi:hypothetical protein
MQREQVADLVFGLLTAAPQLVTKDRKFRAPEEVAGVAMPALIQRQTGEQWQRQRGLPGKATLTFEWWIYVNTSRDPGMPAASTVLNPILDAIQAALDPANGGDVVAGVQTLGGTVSHAWLDERLEIYEGVLDDCVSIAVITVHVLI